jgi:membrane-bound ClpP family serine protease
MIVTIAIIVVFGILLMVAETFLPGGIAGILGLLCILAGIVLAFTAEELAHWPLWGRTLLAFSIIAFSSITLLIWMRCFAVKLFHRAFTLEASSASPKTDGVLPDGTEGFAVTELRPMGRADFGSRRLAVRCQTGFAPQGSPVKVIGSEPGNLLVIIQPQQQPNS